MKKVLLTTTAVALTAGMVSAGDMSMSGSISLTYGGFGTGSAAAAAKEDFSSEADLNIAASSSSGSISMSGTLEIDEDGSPSAGPVVVSSGAFSFTYDKNDVGGGLAEGNPADGEDDNYGDYTIAYSAGSIGFSYTRDNESDDNVTAVSYSSGALSLSMTSKDENGAKASSGNVLDNGPVETIIAATYVTGPYTISLSGNDAATQAWDASVAMASGDTTVTVAADEAEVMKVSIGYTAGNMAVTASQEFNGDDETEFTVSYTEGALTFGAAYDSGQGTTAHYGDEAQLVVSAGYTDDRLRRELQNPN
jgi:hypothetical protein